MASGATSPRVVLVGTDYNNVQYTNNRGPYTETLTTVLSGLNLSSSEGSEELINMTNNKNSQYDEYTNSRSNGGSPLKRNRQVMEHLSHVKRMSNGKGNMGGFGNLKIVL